MSKFTPKQIATAVQGHIKALRLLGWGETCFYQIACALNLTEAEVETAFHEYRIVGGSVHKNKKIGMMKSQVIHSPAVTLKSCKRK